MSSPYDERAVDFECAGERLLGIVTVPAPPAAVGVLVIVGGPQYRAGSHRQYVLLARTLARAGVAAMRFDCRGMGDSSGAPRPFEEAVLDIGAAIESFVRACPGLQRIVLWGLCDAASLALMYYEQTRDPRVAGLVIVDPWIASEEAFAESQARHYLRRPFQLDFWRKLVRGDVDLKGALGDVAGVLARVLRGRTAAPAALPYQELMTRGMDAYSGPVLLLLSGDLSAKNFVQYCEAHPRWTGFIDRGNVARGEVPGSNHTFASTQWRGQVEQLTLDWLAAKLQVRKSA